MTRPLDSPRDPQDAPETVPSAASVPVPSAPSVPVPAAAPVTVPAAAPAPSTAGSTAPGLVPAGPVARDSVRVTIEGSPLHVADLVPDPGLRDAAAAAVRPLPPGRGQSVTARRVEVVVDGWRFEATVEPTLHAVLRERVQRHAAGAGGGQQVVRAPLPGRILRVWVATGDQVEPGSRLCSLEAMKMENEVLAHRAGTILRVGVAPGARVEQGDELVVIA